MYDVQGLPECGGMFQSAACRVDSAAKRLFIVFSCKFFKFLLYFTALLFADEIGGTDSIPYCFQLVIAKGGRFGIVSVFPPTDGNDSFSETDQSLYVGIYGFPLGFNSDSLQFCGNILYRQRMIPVCFSGEKLPDIEEFLFLFSVSCHTSSF